ncbi:MAG: hypothetical protein M0Z49_08090 [Chloroflexi bacterium]|nr:hypothetical protein [Chloroflexota bacterium]
MTDIHDRPSIEVSAEPTASNRTALLADAPASAAQAQRGCTAAQLRRFIKSRPYVPLHELRRRFEMGGETDDLSSLETGHGLAYVGLPPRECALLQDLVRQGEVGVELSLDPPMPVVVGVFPMRPVPRP